MSCGRKIVIRILEVSKYKAAHGALHGIEFISALYEEAYITATFAAFGALTMLLGALFLEGHHHD